jgi:hypothetical protein
MPPPVPPSRRYPAMGMGIAIVLQAAALLALIWVLLFTGGVHSTIADICGVLLIAAFGWLMVWNYREYRWINAIRALDRQREGWGGWDNMSDTQRADWLAELRRII